MGTGMIPRDFGGVVRVEIDDAWYDLRTYLGWYDRERLSQLNAAGILMLHGRIKIGDANVPITDASRIQVAFEGMVDLGLQKLLAYMQGWSHRDEQGNPLPISDLTLKRLTRKHARILLNKVDELEAAQDGPDQDSPLPTSSTESLEASSSKTPPPSD